MTWDLAKSIAVIPILIALSCSGSQESHNEAYEAWDVVRVRMETEELGEFESPLLLEALYPYEQDRRWHTASRWRAVFVRSDVVSQRGRYYPFIEFKLPVPASYKEMKEGFELELTAIPRNRGDGNWDPIVNYGESKGEVYRLRGENGEPGEHAGHVRMEVDGKRIRGEFVAHVGYGFHDEDTKTHMKTIRGTFSGIWEVDCWTRNWQGHDEGWSHDPYKTSDYCEQFAKDPWPHAPPNE